MIIHRLLISGTDVLTQILPAILLNCFIVLVIEVLLYNNRQIESEMRLYRIEKEKAIYQFEVLKNQINPISCSTA